MRRLLVLVAIFCFVNIAQADEPTAIERGQKSLTTTAFIPAFWSNRAFSEAWRQWEGSVAKPANYSAAFGERYGLAEAPYPNDGLPMGLRKARYLIGNGIAADCMLCHGSSILGKSYVGLGNSALDIQALFEELSRADGINKKLPFAFSNVRGTNEADGFGVYLLGFRKPDLSLADKWTNLGLRDDVCADVPAWWLLKKKKSMYYTGAGDARSVRALMQFMMHPLNSPSDFHKAEPAFRDILQYLVSLEPPRYPYPIDQAKADRGQTVFKDSCARCHGTYGAKWTYPNRIVPLDEIGTDPNRFLAISQTYDSAYSHSWFGQEGDGVKSLHSNKGYQAPPLDGIWATAPYFHNASVPTLYGVLNSHARPNRFTRSYKTGEMDYDSKQVGWKITDVKDIATKITPIERRKIYDTSMTGRSNRGHNYGDDLTEDDRWAVIEYLKTL